MLNSQDKRKFRRIETNCSLSYRAVDGGQIHEGRCLNICGNGLLMHGSFPAEVGQALEVTVRPNTHVTPPLDAFVEVTRCARDGDGFEIAAAIKGIKGN